MKPLASLGILLALLAGLLPSLAAAGHPPEPAGLAPIDPYILQEMSTSIDGRADVLLRFAQRADLAPAYQIKDWAQRGQYVHEALQATAEHSQANVRSWLRARGIDYQVLAIDNALLVRADEALLHKLAGLEGVAELRGNHVYSADPPIESAAPGGPEAISWALPHIGVDQVWNLYGARGQHIVVANMTTGVEYNHEALLPNYPGRCAGGTHATCWADMTASPCTEPCDYNGSGTHTMGTMAAVDEPSLPYIVGVAPEAQWIACRACASESCLQADLLECANWLLAPGGSSYYRPHVIDAAWGGGSCDPWFQPSVQAWLASGMLPVFPAGHNGPDCATMIAPGDLPEAFSTGGSDSSDLIATWSGRGPSCYGEIKPEVVAPGVGIISTIPGNGWASWQGSGMASAHTAGLAALIMSANLGLRYQPDYVEQVIERTAVCLENAECGGGSCPDPNNVSGWGRIDALAAVSAVLWPSCRPLEIPAGLDQAGGVKRASWGSTDLQLINLAPDPQPLQADFYDPQGERVYGFSDVLGGGQARVYSVTGELPPGFSGTLVVDSSNIAIGVLHLEEGQEQDGNTVFAGMDEGGFGPNAYTPLDGCTLLYVHNTSPDLPAHLMIHLLQGGDPLGIMQRQIPPEGTITLNPAGYWGLPAGFVGSAILEADQPIQVTAHSTCAGFASFNAPSFCDRTLYAPHIPINEMGWISTTLLLHNPNPEWIYAVISHSTGMTEGYSLEPWGERVVYPYWSGPATLQAHLPFVAIVRSVGMAPINGGAWAYRAFNPAETTPAVALSILLSGHEGWETADNTWVMNPSPRDPVAVKARYVSVPDGQLFWQEAVIEPGQAWQVQQPQMPGQRASAMLLADGPILAVSGATNGLGRQQVQDHWIGYAGTNFYFEHEPVHSATFGYTVDGPQVSFQGSALGAAPIDYIWNFGDGSTGTGQTVVHNYTYSGTYTVVMTATNRLGFSSDRFQQDVLVEEWGVEFAAYLPLVYK